MRGPSRPGYGHWPVPRIAQVDQELLNGGVPDRPDWRGDNQTMDIRAGSDSLRITISRATLEFGRPHEVNADDMRYILALASGVMDAEVILVRPIAWAVDRTYLPSPIGIRGSRLTVDAEVLLAE